MRRREVYLSPEAVDDLVDLRDWISLAAGPPAADTFVARLEDFCRRLDLASERGTDRSDIRAGLRVIGFERRVAVAFTVELERVVILRIAYGGRNWPPLLSD